MNYNEYFQQFSFSVNLCMFLISLRVLSHAIVYTPKKIFFETVSLFSLSLYMQSEFKYTSILHNGDPYFPQSYNFRLINVTFNDNLFQKRNAVNSLSPKKFMTQLPLSLEIELYRFVILSFYFLFLHFFYEGMLIFLW